MRRRKHYQADKSNSKKRTILVGFIAIFLVGLAIVSINAFSTEKSPEQAADKLQFDASIAEAEQTKIKDAITAQSATYSGSVSATATSTVTPDQATILDVYVPVTNKYAVAQGVQAAELSNYKVYTLPTTAEVIRSSLGEVLGVTVGQLETPLADIGEDSIVFIPASELNPAVKLLAFNDNYYLDSFTSGAVFRTVAFNGGDTTKLESLDLGAKNKDQVLTFKQTGVTALTRQMMQKVNQLGGPTFFSQEIGSFLADADVTHVSNEVSFRENCQYNAILFCSPPTFIETLKQSGVDLVELTGNHNNDVGRQFNTDSINQYRALGWSTVGGGLNAADAAKPYVMDKKGSNVTVLAYNYPDSPNGVAIATAEGAGANGFDVNRIKTDIAAAKAQGSKSVIVDIQFWECYAYPDGYIEYPICDQPISGQKETFRNIIDLGADMVVGTSAHQPQTFEFYNGKPIYYGLGNLYFDQTNWPGTERGIILTHYYQGGVLLQTKLTPTVYNKNYQVRIMDASQTEYQLERLQSARSAAGL